jgi:hypothetical protein
MVKTMNEFSSFTQRPEKLGLATTASNRHPHVRKVAERHWCAARTTPSSGFVLSRALSQDDIKLSAAAFMK